MFAYHRHDASACLGTEAARYSPRPLTEGEQWTAEALITLRRRRYRPGAWHAFLHSARMRSRASVRERPRIARQARAWGAMGAFAWLALCASPRARAQLTLRTFSGVVWWALVWQMLDWHLGMAEGGDGRPRSRLSPADALTLARFWLVPLVFGTRSSSRALPAVIVIGGATDWLDGRVARRCGRTRLGRDLDTTADLAFLTSAAVVARSAGRLSRLGFWLLMARHTIGTVIALGAIFGRARRPAIRARPFGGGLRFGGLALSSAGAQNAGTFVLLVGSLVPPRSTAPELSVA